MEERQRAAKAVSRSQPTPSIDYWAKRVHTAECDQKVAWAKAGATAAAWKLLFHDGSAAALDKALDNWEEARQASLAAGNEEEEARQAY